MHRVRRTGRPGDDTGRRVALHTFALYCSGAETNSWPEPDAAACTQAAVPKRQLAARYNEDSLRGRFAMTAASISNSISGSQGLLAGELSTHSETSVPRSFLGNHTYSCALPVRGGVCNCQSDHDPSTDPWPYLSARSRSGVAQHRSSRAG